MTSKTPGIQTQKAAGNRAVSPDTPPTSGSSSFSTLGALLGSLDQREVEGLETLISGTGSLKRCVVHRVKEIKFGPRAQAPDSTQSANPQLPLDQKSRFSCARASLLEDRGEDSASSHWSLQPAQETV